MDIKILGSGCSNCITLEERTRQALADLGRTDTEDTVTKVTDFVDIASYGVMSTPALVVDEQVVLAGKLPSVSQLKTLLGTGFPIPG
ncbi:MAG TPA: thioredoxin family protein [Acidimicrobiia bacterium]|nr:thioredoxin family protein [Acidimicrobiia bacterium]